MEGVLGGMSGLFFSILVCSAVSIKIYLLCLLFFVRAAAHRGEKEKIVRHGWPDDGESGGRVFLAYVLQVYEVLQALLPLFKVFLHVVIASAGETVEGKMGKSRETEDDGDMVAVLYHAACTGRGRYQRGAESSPGGCREQEMEHGLQLCGFVLLHDEPHAMPEAVELPDGQGRAKADP